MFGYVTFNVKYYILSQIFYKKLGDGLLLSYFLALARPTRKLCICNIVLTLGRLFYV